MVEPQIVVLAVAGSSPVGHPPIESIGADGDNLYSAAPREREFRPARKTGLVDGGLRPRLTRAQYWAPPRS